MGLIDTLRFVAGHPLNRGERLKAVARFASWQIRARIARKPLIVPFVGETRLKVSRGQTGATGNIYVGLHELAEMAFVLHFLRPNELFVDVGANVGSFTVLAAGAVRARCVAFEPAPEAFSALCANVALNDLMSNAELHQAALGATDGFASFTSGLDTTNHVVFEDGEEASVRVPMTTLDRALAGREATMIKIDVEGFEAAVLKGSEKTIQNVKLLAVILETIGCGRRYSIDDASLHQQMLNGGFTACLYEPFERKLTEIDGHNTTGNTIYVRDVAAAAARVKAAPRVSVAGRSSI